MTMSTENIQDRPQQQKKTQIEQQQQTQQEVLQRRVDPLPHDTFQPQQPQQQQPRQSQTLQHPTSAYRNASSCHQNDFLFNNYHQHLSSLEAEKRHFQYLQYVQYQHQFLHYQRQHQSDEKLWQHSVASQQHFATVNQLDPQAVATNPPHLCDCPHHNLQLESIYPHFYQQQQQKQQQHRSITLISNKNRL